MSGNWMRKAMNANVCDLKGRSTFSVASGHRAKVAMNVHSFTVPLWSERKCRQREVVCVCWYVWLSLLAAVVLNRCSSWLSRCPVCEGANYGVHRGARMAWWALPCRAVLQLMKPSSERHQANNQKRDQDYDLRVKDEAQTDHHQRRCPSSQQTLTDQKSL